MIAIPLVDLKSVAAKSPFRFNFNPGLEYQADVEQT
jgi:hypothetical protein